MSTSAPISADEFQALEHKVVRAVEIVRRERDARVAAEAEVTLLQQRLTESELLLHQERAEHAAQREADAVLLDRHNSTSRAQFSAIQHEREEVRERVEKLLRQMDEML